MALDRVWRCRRARRSGVPTSTLSAWPQLRWLLCWSVVQSIVLAAFFLVPFARLWTIMPVGPGSAAAPDAGWADTLAIVVVFGVPSLLPFAVLVSRPSWFWHVDLSAVGLLVAGGAIVLPAVVALATYPCCVNDVFDYVARQRLWLVYGQNPLSMQPGVETGDWADALRRYAVVAYGPAWWLGATPFVLGAHSLAGYLIGFKLLTAVAFAGTLVLVWLLAEPRQRLLSVVFVAWNPIVLIDGLVRVHNDILLVPLALGSVWLWRTRHERSSLMLATLAGLVKLTIAPLWLVLAAAWLKRRGWRALALVGLACMGLVVAAYAPFWMGVQTLAPLVAQASETQWSIGAILLLVVGPVLGEAAEPLVRLALLGVWLVVLGFSLRRISTHALDDAALINAAAVQLLAALLLVPTAFSAHYLMPVVALTGVGGSARVRTAVLIVACGAVLNDILVVTAFAGGPRGMWLQLAGNAVLLAALSMAVLRVRRRAPHASAF